MDGLRLAAEHAGQVLGPLQQVERRTAVSRVPAGNKGEQRQHRQLQVPQAGRARDLGGRFQVPTGGREREFGRRTAAGTGQCLRGASRVGERAGGPQVVGEAFGDGLVVHMGAFESVGNAQMQPDGLLPRRGLGDRLADQVVREP
ncbi:hypothetical protein OHA72_45145 [Dactylosporangium sp. NBC_01737]|uniref:hypothetical protein n=1 Tax=Dactylosporangium sp. NBC_01737 TaxID=2975959 RepID=UPI002E1126C1|nr:hypothetical protein OHA72_45145 [Dactylosporangium sp. NBC_01737]